MGLVVRNCCLGGLTYAALDWTGLLILTTIHYTRAVVALYTVEFQNYRRENVYN